MNLERYKIEKLKEVDYFLRGIYLDNIGKNGENNREYEIIVENIVRDSDFINLDFLNTSKVYRKLVEESLLNIKSYRSELESTYLEFATTKEEVDKEVLVFKDKVMGEMIKLKDKVLDKFYQDKTSKREQAFLLDTSLDIFEIELGKDTSKEREDSTKEVIDDIRYILAYIMSLPNMIKDKKEKLAGIHNTLLNNYEPGTRIYGEIMNYYGKLYKERNYFEFDRKYNEMMGKYLSNIEENKVPRSK